MSTNSAADRETGDLPLEVAGADLGLLDFLLAEAAPETKAHERLGLVRETALAAASGATFRLRLPAAPLEDVS